MALGVKLVKDGILTPEQLIEKVCLNPAKIAGIANYDAIGGAVLIDPELSWCVSKDTMLSTGKNTPFIGQTLTGKVAQVFFDEA